MALYSKGQAILKSVDLVIVKVVNVNANVNVVAVICRHNVAIVVNDFSIDGFCDKQNFSASTLTPRPPPPPRTNRKKFVCQLVHYDTPDS